MYAIIVAVVAVVVGRYLQSLSLTLALSPVVLVVLVSLGLSTPFDLDDASDDTSTQTGLAPSLSPPGHSHLL